MHPPSASSPTRTFRHMDAHTDNKKPLMAQKPAAAWSSACQKSNFYYNYYYYPAAFATFPCFALKPWTPPLCSREATLSLICRLELNLCCRVTCNALETSLTAGVQWLGTSLWMLVYFIIMETNNILFISKVKVTFLHTSCISSQKQKADIDRKCSALHNVKVFHASKFSLH